MGAAVRHVELKATNIDRIECPPLLEHVRTNPFEHAARNIVPYTCRCGACAQGEEIALLLCSLAGGWQARLEIYRFNATDTSGAGKREPPYRTRWGLPLSPPWQFEIPAQGRFEGCLFRPGMPESEADQTRPQIGRACPKSAEFAPKATDLARFRPKSPQSKSISSQVCQRLIDRVRATI